MIVLALLFVCSMKLIADEQFLNELIGKDVKVVLNLYEKFPSLDKSPGEKDTYVIFYGKIVGVSNDSIKMVTKAKTMVYIAIKSIVYIEYF